MIGGNVKGFNNGSATNFIGDGAGLTNTGAHIITATTGIHRELFYEYFIRHDDFGLRLIHN